MSSQIGCEIVGRVLNNVPIKGHKPVKVSLEAAKPGQLVRVKVRCSKMRSAPAFGPTNKLPECPVELINSVEDFFNDKVISKQKDGFVCCGESRADRAETEAAP